MLKLVICDDERPVAEGLARMIDAVWQEPHQISICANGEQLEGCLTGQGEPDILLLDIQLVGQDGISLAQWIARDYPRVKIVFITGDIENSRRIFAGKPSGFLVKPIEKAALLETLRRVTAELAQSPERLLTIEQRGSVLRIPVREIWYVESELRQARIHTAADCYTVYRKLDELEAQLPPAFLRCHKSYLVNPDYVRRLCGNDFELNDGTRIPISRRCAKQTREAFYRYLGETL